MSPVATRLVICLVLGFFCFLQSELCPDGLGTIEDVKEGGPSLATS